ncbi:ig-like domain-containing protein [Caerostris extrusa]|uniref:Ig-like domain-containing protein n=1 Tax=Caerostris extrusa TaxID=172846 RepID=A0AAV4VPJ5_CAEEX|nr:ig-like domain-containing protein [Caerostris extrusa]
MFKKKRLGYRMTDCPPQKLGLRFRVQEDHFRSEEMRLKCTATLAKIIKITTVETISVGPHRTSGFHVSASSASVGNSELDFCSICLYIFGKNTIFDYQLRFKFDLYRY